jgi:hypothetical protein
MDLHAHESRVSDPNPFRAYPDPGFEEFADADPDLDPGWEKFADPDPVLSFNEKLCLYKSTKQKNIFVSGSKCGSGSRYRDSENADPMRIRIRNPA